jgi:hypothetical protein
MWGLAFSLPPTFQSALAHAQPATKKALTLETAKQIAAAAEAEAKKNNWTMGEDEVGAPRPAWKREPEIRAVHQHPAPRSALPLSEAWPDGEVTPCVSTGPLSPG